MRGAFWNHVVIEDLIVKWVRVGFRDGFSCGCVDCSGSVF